MDSGRGAILVTKFYSNSNLKFDKTGVKASEKILWI